MRHYELTHMFDQVVHRCALCSLAFPDFNDLVVHREEHVIATGEFVKHQAAFKGKALIYR